MLCGQRDGRSEGGFAMRRFGVIVALGALLGMFAGVLTAAPALAGRGPKWQLTVAAPFTVPKVILWVQGPGDRNGQQGVR